jgi:serine/threonine-protein kinase
VTLNAGTPIGKYVVRRLLAEGGMGEVYLCTARGPEGFEREVVLKKIRALLSNDPEFVKMFVAEARVASRLNHPNLVQIFDFDKYGDTYVLAMEYVPGHSLREVRQWCRELMVSLPALMAAHIAEKIASGLHYAHCKTDGGAPLRLVHRDCTPHNVLLSYEGAIKLADFGIAKASDRSTAPGVLKGKYAYMSPEQAQGLEVDGRTDIFALGIVLWEMLTGMQLFTGDSDVAMLQAVQKSVIAPPARLNPDVPEELSAIVMKALERPLESRYQTAQEMEWALGQFIRARVRTAQEIDVGAFLRNLFPPEVQEAIRAPRGQPADEDGSAKTAFLPGPAVKASVSRVPTQILVAEPRPSTADQRRGRFWRWAWLLPLVSAGAAAASVLLLKPKLPPAELPGSPPAHSPAAILPTAPVSPARADKGAPVPDEPPPLPISPPNEEEEPQGVSGPTPAVANGRAGGDDASPTPPSRTVRSAHRIRRTSARREALTPEAQNGTLVIRVEPWAVVTVDRKNHGIIGGTRKIRLSPGKHLLRFQYNDDVKEQLVEIEPGKELSTHFRAGSELPVPLD